METHLPDQQLNILDNVCVYMCVVLTLLQGFGEQQRTHR